jgi:prophage regulatory protein
MRWARDPVYAHLGFPKPVRIGANSIAFVESEIEDWLLSRIAARDGQPSSGEAAPPER